MVENSYQLPLKVHLTLTNYPNSVRFTDSDGDDIYTGEIWLSVSSWINNDSIPEPDANMKLTLAASTGYQLGTTTEGVIRVIDDDGIPTIAIKADQGSIVENEGPPTFELIATDIYKDQTVEIKATARDEGGQFILDIAEHQRPSFQVDFTDPDGDGTLYWRPSINNSTIRKR